MRKLVTFIISILLVSMVFGCVDTRDDELHSFHNGAVLLEYKQFATRDTDDYILFTFYENGSYTVLFERQRKCKNGTLPDNFDIVVSNSPRIRLIKEYILPDAMIVTVIKDEKSESKYIGIQPKDN